MISLIALYLTATFVLQSIQYVKKKIAQSKCVSHIIVSSIAYTRLLLRHLILFFCFTFFVFQEIMGQCGPLNIPQDCSLCLIKPHVLKGMNESILLLRKRSLLNFGCGICHTVILLYIFFFCFITLSFYCILS